jgi:hypothetical protein
MKKKGCATDMKPKGKKKAKKSDKESDGKEAFWRSKKFKFEK